MVYIDKDYKRNRYKNDKEYRSRVKATDARRRVKLKKEVLLHYSRTSDISCADCGEGDIRVLTIDHLNGNGTKHRKIVGTGQKFYYWLKKMKNPKGYETVCMNCNLKRKYPLCEDYSHEL